jgi:hypothetical protein
MPAKPSPPSVPDLASGATAASPTLPSPQTGSQVKTAAQWVVDNFQKVVAQEGTKITFYWERAATPPPNSLAENYMVLASNNFSGFFKDMVPKLLGEEKEDTGLDEAAIAEEKRAVIKLRSILREHVEMAKEKKRQRLRVKDAKDPSSTRKREEVK